LCGNFSIQRPSVEKHRATQHQQRDQRILQRVSTAFLAPENFIYRFMSREYSTLKDDIPVVLGPQLDNYAFQRASGISLDGYHFNSTVSQHVKELVYSPYNSFCSHIRHWPKTQLMLSFPC
jgi:hypothetical protein